MARKYALPSALTAVSLALLATGFSLQAAGKGLDERPVDAVVAKVGGQPLHEAVVRMAAGAYLAQHTPSRREDIEDAEEHARIHMARKLALAQAAEKDGIAKDPVVQGQIAYYRIQVLAQAYIQSQIQAHPISKADIEAEYAPGGKVMCYHLQHILLPQEHEAKKIEHLLAEKKAKFGKLAKEYSADGHSAGKNGDLGWMRLDSFDEYQIVDAIRALKPGQNTKPLLTSYGWEIFRLVEAPQQIKNSVTFKHLPEKVIERLGDRIKQRREDRIEAAVVNKVSARTGSGKPLDIKLAHE